MPGFLWSSIEEKEQEWLFAREKLSPGGNLLSHGAKLRRKDHPDALKHSFMVMDNRIIALSGKGIHLGEGRDAHVKLAEDEAGNLFALKIFSGYVSILSLASESQIASDLGVAGLRASRTNASKRFPKHYIAYQYLGTCLFDYLYENKPLSLDKRYELCIKISLALHEIHTGKKAKSTEPYLHNDIHSGNLVIDAQGEPHFIDFGRACPAIYDTNVHDIASMLLLFFLPSTHRNYHNRDWIFGNWLGKYEFSYSPVFSSQGSHYYIQNSTIHIYVSPDDKNEKNAYPIIRYAVIDLYGVIREGSLNLSDIGLDSVTPKYNHLRWYDFKDEKRALVQKSIRGGVTDRNGYTLSKESRNETLVKLLTEPTAFSRTTNFPTALDIAEILTLCRLQLETYQNLLAAESPEMRLKAIQILNSISTELLILYEQLRKLPDTERLDKSVKNYILSQLLTSPAELSDNRLDFLNLQFDETQTIKLYIDNLFADINHAKDDLEAEAASSSIYQGESEPNLVPVAMPPVEIKPEAGEAETSQFGQNAVSFFKRSVLSPDTISEDKSLQVLVL